jgi:valyl-tRNA synthetase
MLAASETNLKDLPAQYDHAGAQERWYQFWEERGYFHAEADDPQRPEPFCIVIPPPNVTGALHLGHALNNTLQDILVRMKRMQGKNTLWMPGTDHAGIATQAVVERRLLEEEKKSRHDLGREGLVERIWQWKKQYEARIIGQLKQLGCSCDWQRTRFTLDDTCARAVRETFFRLFKDGKIYRGKRLVNWDTFLQTAVSDDEVYHEPVKGHFWHIKYPFVDSRPGEPDHVVVATTRPETMLGDTAVAVHPDPAAALDKAEAELRERLAAAPKKERADIQQEIDAVSDRRKAVLPRLIQLRDMALAGRKLELPLTDRQIPLIGDEWAKPELGSGCVKITPAHDANDYDVWQRNLSIGAINILNPDGTLNDSVPEKYRHMKVQPARSAVVADLEVAGLVVEVEDREVDLAHSDRSKTPIEPYLADQWFVAMGDTFPLPPGEDRDSSPPLPKGEGARGLAQSAMDAVTDGRVKIVPDRYAKGYLDWLSEKRDWPIGRQLWWGHRLPVWYVTVSDAYAVIAPPNDYEVIGRTLHVLLRTRGGLEPDDYVLEYMRGAGLYQPQIRICARNEKADTALEAISVEIKEKQASGKFDGWYDDLHTLRYIDAFWHDDEVLDTWFSSALWPHSTLGWPEQTPELAKFYPTNVLITSRDIITLWVARMVLTGLYNVGDVPFHTVYIHPKILDGYGESMSKSKGNGVDPLDVIEKFGTDALRFGLAYLTTETQDVRMPVEFECPYCGTLINQTQKNRRLPRVKCDKCGQAFSTQWAETDADKALLRGAVVSERFELGRNFCNKLWNASRFALMNFEGYEPGPVADEDLTIEDRWLLSRLATVTGQVTEALDSFRYADAARALYGFAWDEFCSFYVEMTKTRFGVPEQRQTAQRVLAHALDTLLRLLHPMIPFLTEEVWQLLAKVAPQRGLGEPAGPPARPGMKEPSPDPSRKGRGLFDAAGSICIAPWPSVDAARQDATIEEQFADFQAVLGAVREIRSRQNIPLKDELQFCVRCEPHVAELLRPMQPYFTQMARATATDYGPSVTPPDLAASVTPPGAQGAIEVHVDVSRFIDVEAERSRLEKQRNELAKFAASIEKKLANKSFVDRAPADVVQQQRDKLAEVNGQLASVQAALGKLQR